MLFCLAKAMGSSTCGPCCSPQGATPPTERFCVAQLSHHLAICRSPFQLSATQ